MRGTTLSLFFVLGFYVQTLWALEKPFTVRLLDQATVAGPDITLGDVAQLAGDEKPFLDRLGRMVLEQAAPVGSSVVLNRSAVNSALSREGYSTGAVVWEGSDACRVLTQVQDVSPDQLLESAKLFIRVQTGEDAKNLDIKLLSPTKSIKMPAGKLEIHFRPSLIGQYEGVQILTAECSTDGHAGRVIPVRLNTQIFRLVVVTKKEVRKGEKFTNANIGFDRLPSDKVSKGTLQKLEDVLGRSAGMDLKAGTPVRFSEINDPPMIHRGEVVQGLVITGNVEISVSVRAQTDGRAGEEIVVENTDTHKVLRAKVLDENKVQIDQKKP